VRESTALVVVAGEEGSFLQTSEFSFVFPKNQSDLLRDAG